MNKDMHRQWGEIDMLYYCPKSKVVWQYDRHRKIHIWEDMPTYGLKRKVLNETN